MVMYLYVQLKDRLLSVRHFLWEILILAQILYVCVPALVEVSLWP